MSRRILSVILAITIIMTSCFTNTVTVYAADSTEESSESGFKRFWGKVTEFFTGSKDDNNADSEPIGQEIKGKVSDAFQTVSEKTIEVVDNIKSHINADKFKEGYQYCANLLSTKFAVVTTVDTDLYTRVQETIETTKQNIISRVNTKQPIPQSAGFAAEEWQAGTYNIDAAAKNSSSYATANHSYAKGSPDVTLSDGQNYSLKYYASGEGSADAQLADVYVGQGRVIPKEQINDANAYYDKLIKSAEGYGDDIYNATVKSCNEAKANLTAKVSSADGVESMPLSKADAEKLVTEARDGNLDMSDFGVSVESATNMYAKAAKTGGQTALINIAVTVVPELIGVLGDLIKDGKVEKDIFKQIGTDTLSSGSEGFILGYVSHLVSAKCAAGAFGETLKSASSSTIAAIIVITFQGLKEAYRLSQGQITVNDFLDIMCDYILMTAISFESAAVIALLIPASGAIVKMVLGFAATFLLTAVYENVKDSISDAFVNVEPVILTAAQKCGETIKKAATVSARAVSDTAKNIGAKVSAGVVSCGDKLSLMFAE